MLFNFYFENQFFLLDHTQLIVQVYFVSFTVTFPNVVISVLGKELYSFLYVFPMIELSPSFDGP